jgi:hypothetical protein
LTRVTLKRDAAGRIVEERQSGSGGIPWYARLVLLIATFQPRAFNMSRYYSYDELGRRTEVRSRFGVLGEDWEHLEYNDHGDIAVRRAEHVSRSFSIGWIFRSKRLPDRRHESVAHFEYVYDSAGNWVEETVRSTASKEPSSRRIRTIQYWG